MADRKQCNGHGTVSAGNGRIMISNTAPINVDVSDLGHDSDSSGMGNDIEWITYRRRRDAKSSEGEKVWGDSESNCIQKSMKHILDESSCIQKQLPAQTSFSSCDTLKLHRNNVLEKLCQSLEDEDALKKCIQNAIVFNPGCVGRSTAQESTRFCNNRNKCSSVMGVICTCLDKEAKSSLGMPVSKSVNELNHFSANELCLSVIHDIIVSDKFAQLCSLFLENFQGIKVDRLLNFRRINSRMKDKSYKSSPLLFHADIQQEWNKLEKVGTDIITLAKFLSEKTSASFQEQLGSSAHIIPKDALDWALAQKSDVQTKLERAESCALDESNTCRNCGEKAEGRSCLVCDSCEEMFHINCVEPAVKEIPIRSWYCANCTAQGIESPHDDCIACERINSSGPSDGNEEEDDSYELDQEKLVTYGGCKGSRLCKFCSNAIKENEDYKVCGHAFCTRKLYHARCLSSTELISHGPCWYCPSCLCRTCLTDQDDDDIVLCDGCDHAYHTYCVKPRLSTIPDGKWFCKNCATGLQRICEAKRLHNSMQSMSEKRQPNGKLKQQKTSQKSGGVDMLLNAAQTLIYEDNLSKENGAYKK